MTQLRRRFQAAQRARGSIDFNLDEPGTSPIRVIDFTSAVMGDAGNEEIVEAVFDPVDWDFKDRAAASIDGFASYAAFEWGGRDFALEADSKGAATSALTAVFNSFSRRGGAPLVEASMDGFAAGARIGVRSGTNLDLTAVTKGEAGNRLQVLFTQQGRTSAIVTDIIESGGTVRVRAGRETNVTWATLAQAISDQTNTPITATATGNQRATNFRFGTINGTRYRLSEGADAVDADTLVVRHSALGTPTVTAVLNAINGITSGKRMTASSPESGNSEVSDTSGGARASVTIPIATNANLVVQFAREGTAGNGITVVASDTLGGGYGASFADGVLTLTLDNARQNPNQIAAGLNARTNDFNISASGSAAETDIFTSSVPGRINDQTNTLSGGAEGSAGLIPPSRRVDLRGGEDAKPNTTVLRVRGATMAQIVAAMTAVPSRQINAALGSGADGPSSVLSPSVASGRAYPRYPRPFASVRLTGGEAAANVEEVMETPDLLPVEFSLGGSLTYYARADWQTANSGNITVRLQRLIPGGGADGADVWEDYEADDHTFTLNGGSGVNNRREDREQFTVIPGWYRFMAVGSAAGLRAGLALTIDDMASTGVNPDKQRDFVRTREATL